jgi:glucosamine-6-phosphate deaminase
MEIAISKDAQENGAKAATLGGSFIRECIRTKDSAHIILATGASQLEMLDALVKFPGIDWSRVEVFHLDEYIGLPETHPASFRRYLKERFVACVKDLKAFHAVNGDAENPIAECARLDALIAPVQIDVAFIGIGENGHLAFNDPPADFQTTKPYIVVQLDEACRKQQFSEGWFPTLEEVPTQAISMSIHQIMKSRRIICTVPDRRKSKAVYEALNGPLTNRIPASILRQHADCHLFLDREAASLCRA